MTFVATAHALQWLNIRSVFCEIRADTLCLDPQEVERHVSPRTTGIIGVHLFGQPCDTDALQEIADRRGLRLIFDAAHAFACSRGNSMIGKFGDAEILSFHATKFLNTLEGGAILTDNDELAGQAPPMRNFGSAGYDAVASLGINGKMNEFPQRWG